MPIPFFRCDKCRREYPTREAAEACEAEHLMPVSVTVGEHSIWLYPYSVEILFSNDEKKIYVSRELGG